MPNIPLIALGFLLGLRHALESDHLLAVSTLAAETKTFKTAAAHGALWGAGHGSMLIAVALLFSLFNISLPVQFHEYAETVVGIVLTTLGIRVIYVIRKRKIHIHTHEHDGMRHMHLHSHEHAENHEHKHLSLRAFTIGMLHGLAGSGALLILLAVSAKTVTESLLFVILFGFGGVCGMTFMSALLAAAFLKSARFYQIQTALYVITGMSSMLFGLHMIKIGLIF